MSCNGEVDDFLQPLSPQDIPKLTELLKQDLPLSTVAYNWILTQTRWQANVPGMIVEILCPRGEWSDGVVIALCKNLALNGTVYGVVYSISTEKEVLLKEALMTTRRIPWGKSLIFAGVIERHVGIVEQVIKSKNLTEVDLAPCYLHFLEAQQATQHTMPELPPDVRIGPLDVTDLDVLCDNWPHYSLDYRPVILNMITQNPTTGVFVRENDKEVLAAMTVQNDYGGLGLLQTVPRFRRRGYAALALANQTRIMGQKGISPHVHIIENNHASLKMFKNTPYKIVGKTSWVLME